MDPNACIKARKGRLTMIKRDPKNIIKRINSLGHSDLKKFAVGMFAVSLFGDNIFESAGYLEEHDGAGCVPEMKESILFACSILNEDMTEFIQEQLERN